MQTSFIQNRNEEMKNSLYTEFRFSSKKTLESLLESKGSMNGINDYIRIIMSKLKLDTFSGKIDNVITVSTNDFLSINDRIANNFIITIDFKESEEKQLYGDFVSSDTDELVNNKLNNLEINFIAHCPFWYAMQELPPLIAHEFLHAYENLMRIRKGNKSLFDTAEELHYPDNDATKQNAHLIGNDIIVKLSQIYYACTSFERNAYVAQLNQQIDSFKNTPFDSNQAFQALEKTSTYQGYLNIGNNLQYIYDNKQQFKTDIEDWYYQTFKNRDLNYKQIITRLLNLYNKTWRKIRKTTASYLRHLYENKTNKHITENFSNLF